MSFDAILFVAAAGHGAVGPATLRDRHMRPFEDLRAPSRRRGPATLARGAALLALAAVLVVAASGVGAGTAQSCGQLADFPCGP
jgi:hypothetical protein